MCSPFWLQTPQSCCSFRNPIKLESPTLKGLTEPSSSWGCYVFYCILRYVNAHRLSSNNVPVITNWPQTTFCSSSSFGSHNKVLMAGIPFYLQHQTANVYYTPSPWSTCQWKLSLFNYSIATGWESHGKKIIWRWKELCVWCVFRRAKDQWNYPCSLLS